MSSKRRNPRAEKVIRCAIEALEERRLMSLTITTVDGITSTAGAPATVNLYTGQTLHVDAVSYTGALSDVPSPQKAKYRWDFGDTTSGSTYDQLPGFNAGHVYDTAGNYTCTVTVTQPSGVSAVTLNVAVTSNPNLQAFSTTTNQGTLYIAANGSASNLKNCTPTTPIEVKTAL